MSKVFDRVEWIAGERDAREYVDGAGRNDEAVMFALRRFEPTWRARALRAFGWLATTTIGVECGLHGVPL